MTDDKPEPSAEYVIRMGPGVSDRLVEIRDFLAAGGLKAENDAKTYEDLANIRGENVDRLQSYIRCLISLITTTERFGDQNIYLDFAPKSLGFNYKSGYTGAMIFHDPDWSVHT